MAGGQLLPRFVIFGAAAVRHAVVRARAPWSPRAVGSGPRRAIAIIVVGDGEEGDLAAHRARGRPGATGGRRRRVRHRVDDRQPATDSRSCAAGETTGASVVVLSRRASEIEHVVDQAAALHRRGVRVRTLTGFYTEWLGKLPISELERASMLFDIGEIHGRRYARVKRLVDVAFGLAGTLALASLLLPFVARRRPRRPTAGRCSSARRASAATARVFTMWKLRTMDVRAAQRLDQVGRRTASRRSDASCAGPTSTSCPQALNILRGDLSIVGPRPEQPHYVEELTDKIPFYDLRHVVRPGLTGWAQVKFGYAGDEHDALEKLQYDFFYLQRQTLGLDVRIVARTVRDVCKGGGR